MIIMTYIWNIMAYIWNIMAYITIYNTIIMHTMLNPCDHDGETGMYIGVDW